MPIHTTFRRRLFRRLPEIIKEFGSPFHIYDERGIRETGELLTRSMPKGFKEFFAVKALPDPAILRIMHDLNFGFDCSSEIELRLARAAGAKPEDIMFTSNNTTRHEFDVALGDGGCILNLDDVSFLSKPYMKEMIPELVCFRINPGNRQTGSSIIGEPTKAKYGIMWEQLIPAYRTARELGASRFGLHTMVASNDRDYRHMEVTLMLLLEAAQQLHRKLGIAVEFINIGGGIGIPYRKEEGEFNIRGFGDSCHQQLVRFEHDVGFVPRLFMENGRYITGPHGVLVNRAINRKDIYQTHIGVEVAMPALMRPAMYDAYHEITVLSPEGRVRSKKHAKRSTLANVVGPICENCDRLATQRWLPEIQVGEDDGDIIVTHDTGAHGAAMGFNYNGRTRPKGLLLRCDGTVVLTRRAETVEDLLRATEGL